jgi:hypothetical protein
MGGIHGLCVSSRRRERRQNVQAIANGTGLEEGASEWLRLWIVSSRRRQMGFSLTCVPAYMYIRHVQKHRRDMRPFVHPSIRFRCLSLRASYVLIWHMTSSYVICSLDSTRVAHDSRSSFSDREKQRRHRRPLCPALTLRYLDLQSPFVLTHRQRNAI